MRDAALALANAILAVKGKEPVEIVIGTVESVDGDRVNVVPDGSDTVIGPVDLMGSAAQDDRVLLVKIPGSGHVALGGGGSAGGGMTLIGEIVVVGTSTSQVTFSSIPQTFGNLRLIVTGALDGSASGGQITLRFNNELSPTVQHHQLTRYGVDAYQDPPAEGMSGASMVIGSLPGTNTPLYRGTITLDILDYSKTQASFNSGEVIHTLGRWVRPFVDGATLHLEMGEQAGMWDSFDVPVTRIDVEVDFATFEPGATFRLYGY